MKSHLATIVHAPALRQCVIGCVRFHYSTLPWLHTTQYKVTHSCGARGCIAIRNPKLGLCAQLQGTSCSLAFFHWRSPRLRSWHLQSTGHCMLQIQWHPWCRASVQLLGRRPWCGVVCGKYSNVGAGSSNLQRVCMMFTSNSTDHMCSNLE